MKEKGFSLWSTATILGVNVRTVQRWFKKGHPIFGKILRKLYYKYYDPESVRDMKDKTYRYKTATKNTEEAAAQAGVSIEMLNELLAKGYYKPWPNGRFDIEELKGWKDKKFDGRTSP
jgi:hypothetical protein